MTQQTLDPFRAWHEFPLACEECGEPVPPDHVRFCSDPCRLAWFRPHQAEKVLDGNNNWRGGKSSHPLYDIYNDMIGRCTRETHARWTSYGGRGITVCQEWRDDFWRFVADMGPRPDGVGPSGRALYSVDRVDNDGPYSPENCRWATYSVQSANRRPDSWATNALKPQNQKRTTCKRGHDTTSSDSRFPSGACKECARERRERGVVRLSASCKRNHDLSEPGAVNRRGECRECVRTRAKERSAT